MLSGLRLNSTILAIVIAMMSLTARAELGFAGAESNAGFTDEQKKALSGIIKDYLVNHPEVMIDVQNALDERAQKEQDAKIKGLLSANPKAFKGAANASAGNPGGDVTVVEFFDFNCGYCRRGLADVQRLVSEDKNVRIVFKEFPILAKGSAEASRVAIAAKRQGKYWEFHQAMLGAHGQANLATALQVASSVGLDSDRITREMSEAAVTDEIEESEGLARQIGINGTPFFIVGDKTIPGAPDDLHDQLARLVAEARKAKCPTC